MSDSLSLALARAAARHAHHAFGLMGNGNAHLIDGLSAAGVPFTAVRHEAGTVAAADAYTRVSQRLAIATTTYGAGFTNTLTALAEAAQARTPMLVIVGDAPNSGPRPWDVDQEMLAAALGVRTIPLSVTGIDATVDRAVAYARRVRRPVVLAIPYDIATEPVVDATPATAAPTGAAAAPSGGIDLNDPSVLAALAESVAQVSAPDAPPAREPGRRETSALGAAPATGVSPHLLEEAAQVLLGAERPLIIAGRGAHLADARAELDALADRLGALTSTTALTRGFFSRGEFDLGVTGGFGQSHAMRRVEEADVVIVAGATLNQFTMRFGDLFGRGTTVIRLDDEQVAAPATNAPIRHLLLQGDAKDTARMLLEVLEAAPERAQAWRDQVPGLEPGGALRVRDADSSLNAANNGLAADGRLDPRAVASVLADRLPTDRHVTTDGGHFIGWSSMYWPIASPERLIMVGTAYQTIGLGFPTVAGVAAAAPDTTVVLSTGDGGGLMALADLETAIRTASSLVVVVWNDGAYGAEVHLYGEMGLDQQPMRIPDVDFAALATALGATGVRVETLADLDALDAWTSAGATGALVLDCRISRTIVAEYQREIQRVNGLDVPETDAAA